MDDYACMDKEHTEHLSKIRNDNFFVAKLRTIFATGNGVPTKNVRYWKTLVDTGFLRTKRAGGARMAMGESRGKRL